MPEPRGMTIGGLILFLSIPCAMVGTVGCGGADSGSGNDGWTRIFDEPSATPSDIATGGSDTIYVAGSTFERFDAEGPELDGFVAKLDASGEHQWARLQDTSLQNLSRAVATDGSGNVYVVGRNQGGTDSPNTGFVGKYDASGQRQWDEQMGTAGDVRSYGVATDSSGNIYVAGQFNGTIGDHSTDGDQDGFLVSYTPSGDRRWIRVQSTSLSDRTRDVTVGPSDAIYVAGGTTDRLGDRPHSGAEDGFLARYTPDGERRWVRIHGSSGGEFVDAVDTDASGHIYVAGRTDAAFDDQAYGGGRIDGYVIQYDGEGNPQWTRLHGGPEADRSKGLAVAGDGTVHVTGDTRSGFGGEPYNGGEWDSFVVTYERSGERLGTRLIGTDERDLATAIAVDDSNRRYLVGDTGGALNGIQNENPVSAGFLFRMD